MSNIIKSRKLRLQKRTHLVVDSFPDVSLDISLRHEHDVVLDQIPDEKYLERLKNISYLVAVQNIHCDVTNKL